MAFGFLLFKIVFYNDVFPKRIEIYILWGSEGKKNAAKAYQRGYKQLT